MEDVRKPTARYYKVLRSAHMERAEEIADGQLTFYKELSYDIKPTASDSLAFAHQCSPMRLALELRRQRVRTLEINEPAMVSAWPILIQILLTTWWARRRRRLELVAYAIENLPVEEQIYAKLRVRASFVGRIGRFCAKHFTNRLTRIAFGTSAARDLYFRLSPAVAPLISRQFPAFPSASKDKRPVRKIPLSVLFVGALDERKGIRLTMDAWTEVSKMLPKAQLTILGKGALEREVAEWCEQIPSATLTVDPPRGEIHEKLGAASVLVLFSQRTPGWREQIGLPIVEALSHGCTVATTDETGVAEELRRRGHTVIPADSSASVAARALTDALLNPLEPDSVIAGLPSVDGRLAAHIWLMGGTLPLNESADAKRNGED
ncbi:glycosyltransferase [Mycolicibacterium chubuense]|uniref:glycosyltransferase n=1 Tax=Mycolicibacterium chubuense TaxID=1800 RepID=UPI0013018B21|nr:glycosyltransferase [Mycolicibacterium chubuense]